MPTYKRYEELRPDELETLLTEAPRVAGVAL
jgi:hypothetical protein